MDNLSFAILPSSTVFEEAYPGLIELSSAAVLVVESQKWKLLFRNRWKVSNVMTGKFKTVWVENLDRFEWKV
jgi:hypothetical protein